jgi:cyclopropane fatty-acyl-phospholipid synthase-like methyltransferase|tara:strand:- start:4988 stop:5869 length:882 start_codon:yes stop_codon:yes gene_type:complete
MSKMKCINCKKNDFKIIYNGKIRSGSYGKNTDKNHKIIECINCGLTRMEEFVNIDYISDSYRLLYNDSNKISDYFKNHDHEQNGRINKIGIEKFRNKIVLDFGSGGGSFLDLVKGISSLTIAVEPFKGFHKSLKERGHLVFSDIKECSEYIDKVDIIISFGVIEHIDDPLGYLKSAFSLIKKDGIMYIETDNLKDILMHFQIPEFDSFYFRTVHTYYFDSKSLKDLCQNAGFTNIKTDYRHGYGISNTFNWLKDFKPSGDSRLEFLSEDLDDFWIKYLEKKGMAELLHFEISK